jgi:hypothetical protein
MPLDLDDFPAFDAKCPPPLATLGATYTQLLTKAEGLSGAAEKLARALRRYVEPIPGVKPGDADKAFALAALKAFEREVAA